MKLNKKGYMLVEIIISFSIAMGIAFYLINLTYKFKNTNEDIYQSTLYLKDKISITKNIMNDLEKDVIKEYTRCGAAGENCLILKTESATKKIEIKNDAITNATAIIYGEIDASGAYLNNASYYKKELEKSLYAGTIEISELDKDYFSITIPVSSLYDDNDYNIKIFAQKNTTQQLLFTYTGNYQVFEAKKKGWYRIDAWGAQGGESLLDGGTRSVIEANSATYCVNKGNGKCAGGRGAYTSGYIELNAGDKLYIYVGGKGQIGQNGKRSQGGYNGGGSGDYDHSDNEGDGGGGGATDIRYFSTPPSNSELNWNSDVGLNSRIMVAAGGGGSSDIYSGLPGGDLISSPKNEKGYVRFNKLEDLSTQQSGHLFGIGQNGTLTRTNYPVAGGGGGYYGGKSVDNGQTSNWANPGAGGSSFISGYAGVNAITSKTSRTATNNTIHYSGKYFINAEMQAGVNEGNGEVNIKFVSENKPERINTNLNEVRYIKDCIKGNNSNEGNHWTEIQAISGGNNIARGKTVTGTRPKDNNDPHKFANAVDGEISNISSSTGFAYMGGDSDQCITVDLENTYSIDEIAVWHYYPDDRTYNNNITSVSKNGTNWKEIMNRTEIETTNGKRENAYK